MVRATSGVAHGIFYIVDLVFHTPIVNYSLGYAIIIMYFQLKRASLVTGCSEVDIKLLA